LQPPPSLPLNDHPGPSSPPFSPHSQIRSPTTASTHSCSSQLARVQVVSGNGSISSGIHLYIVWNCCIITVYCSTYNNTSISSL
ncbi:hypothetical protein C8R43DRAFT_1114541, partial [Mycena crocata]